MAVALHKLLKKSSPSGLISTVKLTQPLVSHTNHIRKPVPTTSSFEYRSTQIANPISEVLDSLTGLVNPIFPFGVHLDSTSSTVLDEFSEDVNFGCGEEVVIRADSVKKKRKKKMNKHKYRKLRKRLRRKT